MVCEVIADIADSYFEKKVGAHIYQLVFEWLKILDTLFFHGLKGLVSLVLCPFGGNNQLFFHSKVNHEKLKWVHAGSFPILKLLQYYLLQVASELKIVAPVTRRIFGCEQLYEGFRVDLGDLTLTLEINLRDIDLSIIFFNFRNECRLVVLYGFLHLSLMFIEVSNLANSPRHVFIVLDGL
jgi:hypothetical protein